MITNAGLAAPLDLSRIPTYSQLSPKITSLALVRANGQVYGVPFVWGPNPLIYDTTVFPQPPESWNVLSVAGVRRSTARIRATNSRKRYGFVT